MVEKKNIREVLLSNTYRQSTRYDKSVLEIDPENRLLSHASRRRLDAESLRDSILYCSGKLDLTAGGPAIETKGKIDKKVEYSYDFRSPRRSIYVPLFRNKLMNIFEIFDFGNPNISAGRRIVTTRPTQALFLLNSPFMTSNQRNCWSPSTGSMMLSGSKELICESSRDRPAKKKCRWRSTTSERILTDS